ncbi:rhomboid family intramembrane serine protease [Evansella cellulosilytica]|uniref:Rhomboid family protein n=1 Tax=Evansella cellulosilytica (strain ATCC 21833 / DSM 2522 / FERM P-1141 / JCM 9156 / N-4) TaxID=649639 RepID=E6TV38_EVAC2|nr:rhomboid family intramembrane serine protease [Evansella cellulosilytica]ADU28621.1 Rhomboid family protein [Evansella cellulosilytica DSM 2522]
MFIRNESFGQFVRSYKLVTVLIAINLVIYFWMSMYPKLGGQLIEAYGVGSNYHIAMGELWRIVTPIFLHGSIMHLLFNCFSLFLFGPALEKMLGKGKLLIAYFATGILANIATFILAPLFYFHLGASGAIYGLFGIYLYMVLVRKDLIDPRNAQLIITILIIGVIMTFINPGINRYAHIFGLISGAALAPILLRKITSASLYSMASDPNEVTFDPNRWQKHAKNKQRLKIIGIVAGVLLLVLYFLQARL